MVRLRSEASQSLAFTSPTSLSADRQGDEAKLHLSET